MKHLALSASKLGSKQVAKDGHLVVKLLIRAGLLELKVFVTFQVVKLTAYLEESEPFELSQRELTSFGHFQEEFTEPF